MCKNHKHRSIQVFLMSVLWVTLFKAEALLCETTSAAVVCKNNLPLNALDVVCNTFLKMAKIQFHSFHRYQTNIQKCYCSKTIMDNFVQVPDIYPGGDFSIICVLSHVEKTHQCGQARVAQVSQWDGSGGLQSQPAGCIYVGTDPFNCRSQLHVVYQ